GKQTRYFACPLSKHDSTQHVTCSKLRLTRVGDVKQHLRRCHRLPIYCPTCGITFTNERTRDAHINHRTCRGPPGGAPIKPEGITEEQGEALARRVNRSHSEAEQWNSIWDILFPGSPRPSSPYAANKTEEAFDMIRNH
ncbi:hypothetical protein B0T25DRAFT_413315, partial [Lasiosphaeria hispida]